MKLKDILAIAPTPMAGLALGIASLGLCWEFVLPSTELPKFICAAIAGVIQLILIAKFLFHPHLLLADLKHPVVGSVVPTFSMGLMAVSVTVNHLSPEGSEVLWLVAVFLHITFLITFCIHRYREFNLTHMVPAWFVPPVGIIVAPLTCPSESLMGLAQVLLWFGIISYAILLPAMLYRLIFLETVAQGAQPTLAILAAPASLSLAGYLNITSNPSVVVVALLFGIALLMTVVVYLAFIKLLRLPFSPGYAAFTFPMAIGATALFKLKAQFVVWNLSSVVIKQVNYIAMFELVIATVVISYVALCYLQFYLYRNTIKKQVTQDEIVDVV